MKVLRREFLQLGFIAAACASTETGSAQNYPTRPITMIVPFAAGGTTDVTARIVGEHMSRTLGQQIVVENVVGAGGTVGTARAMRANPDGHTIEMGQMGTHAPAVALYPNLAYKPDLDFEPIGNGQRACRADRSEKRLSAEGLARHRTDSRPGHPRARLWRALRH